MHSFMAHEKLPPQSSVQDTEVINSVLKIRTINWTLQWLHEVVTLQHLPYMKSKHLIPQVEIPYTQYCSWTFVFAIAHLEEASARTSMNFQEVAD